MRKTILFPRKRIASRTLQEKSQVKTKCFRIGLTRLYAPMVPLAPPPCVRWWNTEEITLKLTRLCLHSLKGGLPTGYHHPGGVDTNEQGAIFHPLNGSGTKGTTGRSNPGRRKQKDSPKDFTRGTTQQNRSSILLYRTTPKFPPVYLFFFGVQNRFFFCVAKEKVVLAPAGQAKNQKEKRSRPPLGRPRPAKRRRGPFPPKEKADL